MDRMDRIIERSKQLRKEANLRLVKEAGGKGQAAKELWRFFTGWGRNSKVDALAKPVRQRVNKTSPVNDAVNTVQASNPVKEVQVVDTDNVSELLKQTGQATNAGKKVKVMETDDVDKLLNQKGWASFGRGAAYTGTAAIGVPWLLSGGKYQPPTQDELSGGSGSGGEGSKGINWLPWMLGVPAAGAAGVGLYKILNSKKPEPLPQIEDAVLSDAEIAAELRKRQEEQLQNEELYT